LLPVAERLDALMFPGPSWLRRTKVVRLAVHLDVIMLTTLFFTFFTRWASAEVAKRRASVRARARVPCQVTVGSERWDWGRMKLPSLLRLQLAGRLEPDRLTTIS
jgi:hypothetical protein